MIKPHIAVFKTGKCLVPGVQIDSELYLNDSNMFLFGTPDTTTSVGKKIPTLGDNARQDFLTDFRPEKCAHFFGRHIGRATV